MCFSWNASRIAGQPSGSLPVAITVTLGAGSGNSVGICSGDIEPPTRTRFCQAPGASASTALPMHHAEPPMPTAVQGHIGNAA